MRTTGVLGQKSDAEGTVAQPFYWRQAVRELGWIEEWIHGQIVAYGPPTFRRANVLTLSCKNRLTCLPRKAARRLPRPTRSGRGALQPKGRVRAGRAARGAAPPGQRAGGFCQLVSAVSRRVVGSLGYNLVTLDLCASL